MIEFRVLIPVASNKGVTFSPEHHATFEQEVLRRFGGFSLLPGITNGQWIGDGGRTYVDNLRTYVIAVPSILDIGPLREVLDFALTHYRQEGLYYGYLGVSEIHARRAA